MEWFGSLEVLLFIALLVIAAFVVIAFRGAADEWGRQRVGSLRNWRQGRKLAADIAARDSDDRRRSEKMAEEVTARKRTLETERVGKRFRVRETRDDTGMILTVLSLNSRHPWTHVDVECVSPPRRTTTRDDCVGRYSQAWLDFVVPADEQRRWTARFRREPDDNEDGWLHYESIPDES